MSSKVSKDTLYDSIEAMLKQAAGEEGGKKRNFTESVELQVSWNFIFFFLFFLALPRIGVVFGLFFHSENALTMPYPGHKMGSFSFEKRE